MITSIEKENLAAHVEISAERYKNLEIKLESLDRRLTTLETYIVEIKENLSKTAIGANKQLITIGLTIIASLMAAVFGLLTQLVGK